MPLSRPRRHGVRGSQSLCDCCLFRLFHVTLLRVRHGCWCQAIDVMHKMQVMFKDGGVFHDSGSDLLTQKAMAAAKGIGIVKYTDGRREVACAIPVPETGVSQNIKQNCRVIFEVFESYMRANFPAHEIINAFSALDPAAPLAVSQRKKLIEALATHEGVCASQLWHQLVSSSEDTGLNMGLFGRATWHCKPRPYASLGQDFGRAQERPKTHCCSGRDAVLVLTDWHTEC